MLLSMVKNDFKKKNLKPEKSRKYGLQLDFAAETLLSNEYNLKFKFGIGVVVEEQA